MKKTTQSIILLVLLASLVFLITKIQLLIIYVFIATVLAITINPLSNFLCGLKIFKYKINTTVSAIICLSLISTMGTLIGYILSPIIIEEIQILSSIQLDEIESFLTLLTNEVNKKFSSYNLNFKLDFKSLINNLNISSVGDVFQSMFEILGNIFLAIFSILFIAFFMIRDKSLLKKNAIKSLSLFITDSEKKINMIIFFIRRYFGGLCLQTTIIYLLFGLGMSILKLPNPWTLALFAAVVNIIPYFGPLIGFFFTVTMVGSFYIDQSMINLLVPFIIKTFILFSSVQCIDNFFIIPSIYSRAFKAHPLEIFLVAMAAGFIGGIMWMIIAMPVYTILRIILSELILSLE